MQQALEDEGPGHPAAEPPGLPHVRRLPAVRPRGQVPLLRRGGDVPQRTSCPDLPHLRRRAIVPSGLPGVRARPTCITAASAPSGWSARSRRRFPHYVVAADGLGHDAAAREPRGGAGGVQGRRGADPAGHADDRQGAGLPQRDAGGRGQRRHGAPPARLPRRRADVPARGPGGRADGPGRPAGAGAGADLLSRASGDLCTRSSTTTRASSPASSPSGRSSASRRSAGWSG